MKTCLLCYREKGYRAFKKGNYICKNCWKDYNRQSIELERTVIEGKNLIKEYKMARARREV